MKGLYFFVLLFIFGGCTSEIHLSFNEAVLDSRTPVIFSLENSTEIRSGKEFQTDETMLLANDNDSMSISLELEEWQSRGVSESDEKASWTNSLNKVIWGTGDQIGIFMRDAAGSNSYARNNVLYSVVAGGASTASLTTSASPLYFPNRTSNIKFYAYYPYSASSGSLTINYTLPANQSTSQALSSADIMFASTGSYTGANPNVVLDFNHQMTLLTFNVKGGLLSGSSSLTQVAVTGSAITNTGTLDLTTGVLTPNTSTTFTPTVNTSQSVGPSATASVDVIINPCTITNNSALNPTQLKVTLTFSGLTGTRTTNLVTSGTFAKGTRYIYNISLVL